MTQEELDKIVEQHQHWIKEDCEGWEDMRANLYGANLYGANLEGANLEGANLKGAYLLKYLHAQLRKGTVFKEDYSLEALYGVYKDYINMARTCGHDVENAYWKYPADLRKAHDKVMREKSRMDDAKLRKRQEKYMEAVKKFMGKVLKVGEMDVFVPETVKEISEQAAILHQCLVTADYIGKVIDHRCVLVFITKNGRPLATAELNRNGKTVQFYGDERSVNIRPGKDADEALDKWIRTFKPRIRKQIKAAA